MSGNTTEINPCPRCGAHAEVRKAGANRVWLECSKYGRNGNCSMISTPQPNRKEAIAAWNKLK
ncbi:hypothetical protein HNQ50_003288 [Silvimonas terrae]|uniref:Restriction alleviation protein Lar n=1 Tax=Silvimonas terrae TaxID=300266 RepID=A0A840RIX9_9NEIS|nr:Lar family restriction alleviation protein [Silvimonas terrae]MBB5192544.1 hypothetical protein [Silvimonas terrae]